MLAMPLAEHKSAPICYFGTALAITKHMSRYWDINRIRAAKYEGTTCKLIALSASLEFSCIHEVYNQGR
jgi:hypothetical protein